MDRELVNEVSDVSGLVKRLRDQDLPMSREEVAQEVEQLERELDQLTIEWKEEMELRMSVAQELREEKALADRLAQELEYDASTLNAASALEAYRKARGL